MKSKMNLAAAVLATSVIAGCASNQSDEQYSSNSGLPAWVMMPSSLAGEGALAATECVPDNASMSILKAKSTALARATLAQQIQIKVQSMDKTYQTLTENGTESGSGSTFESVSKQVSDQMLNGAIPQRFDYLEGPKEKLLFCSMVVLAPEQNRKIFDHIINEANRQLTPDNEALLYQEYRAKRAAEEMEQALDQEG